MKISEKINIKSCEKGKIRENENKYKARLRITKILRADSKTAAGLPQRMYMG